MEQTGKRYSVSEKRNNLLYLGHSTSPRRSAVVFCVFAERVWDPLELELGTVVSLHVGSGSENPGPLKGQLVPLITEPSPQPARSAVF